MKENFAIDAVNHIDDDLLEEYVEEKELLRMKKTTTRKAPWLKFASMAACFCLMIAVTIVAVYQIQNRVDPNIPPAVDSGTDSNPLNRPYKESPVVGESLPVWSWEYKTIYEKYVSIDIDGVTFNGHGKEISSSFIGNKIGLYQATGYDNVEGGIYNADFDVYEIKNIASTRILAVQMDGKYYVFSSEKYAPPATLGSVINEYALDDVTELKKFTWINNANENQFFTLEDDSYIWEVLTACKEARFVDAMGWHETDREYISFTLTSECLGIYKKVLYVTMDGYVWTNAFNGEYLYNIGENAAKQIISFALDQGKQTSFEPYNNAIVGKVVSITDDCIMIDDSILCENPDDGIIFKVLLNDFRILRYVQTDKVSVGDIVQIVYEGNIDIINEYTIDTAVSLTSAVIYGDNVLIPE